MKVAAILILILLMVIIPPASADWWNASWSKKVEVTYSGAIPYQLPINLSNSTGTNNATFIYCNGLCNANFTDIRFILNNATLLSHWLEINATEGGRVWVNITANGTVSMYYHNAGATIQYSNGYGTFPWFDDMDTLTNFTTLGGTPSASGGVITISDAVAIEGINGTKRYNINTAMRSREMKNGSVASAMAGGYGDGTNVDLLADASYLIFHKLTGTGYSRSTITETSIGALDNDYHTYDIVRRSNTNIDFYKDGTYQNTHSGSITTNLYPSFSARNTAPANYEVIDWALIRNYTSPEPQWPEWSVTEDYYDASLISPANGSTQYYNYPPQTSSINFTWQPPTIGSLAYNLQIAKDNSFNLLSVDTTTTSNFSVQVLQGTQQYFWKVRPYNTTSGTYGNWSTTFQFNLTANTTTTGAGIQGIVYEIVSGSNTPIDQATVYIYNNTWSSAAVTGTNGYYLFSNLANGTYSMYAIKNGYDTTATFPVTVNGSITFNDILMKIYISPYVPNFVFEKFIVRDMFDQSFVGVTATVYKGNSLTASLTGTTDSIGQVVFQLIKDQRYRVTFSGGGIGGTVTVYVFAKEESYYVRVLTGFPTGGDRFSDISTNLTSVTINSTWSNLTLIYNDTRASTSILWFYAKNLSNNVTCTLNSTSNVVTLACPVYAAGLYQFGFNATSSVYGTFQEDNIINFDVGKPSTPSIDIGVDQTLLNWGSVILIVFTAALFSVRTVKFGAVIVPLEALVLWVFGWFEPLGGNATGSFLLLSIAVVIGVMVYLRQSEIKVNY